MTKNNIFKEKFYNFIKKIFGLDKLEFTNIKIKKSTILDIIEFSKSSNNKEFVAFLDGKIVNKSLIIDTLFYTEFRSSNNSAIPITHFSHRHHFGSVHNHPSFNNRPSRSDIDFFRKNGIIHIIICKPYSFQTVQFYNHDGDILDVTIID